MKILFVSPYVPHPLSGHGGGVFMYGMIERLARRHEVTLASFCDVTEEKFAADLKKLPIASHFLPRKKGAQASFAATVGVALNRMIQGTGSVLRWEPYYVSKFRDARMERLVAELTGEEAYEIVQIEYTQMARYVAYVKSGATFLHELDVSYRPAYRRYRKATSLWRKAKEYAGWCRWAGYEPAAARKFDGVLAVTDQDRMLLNWLSGSGNARYFPHAVEPTETIPPYGKREARSVAFVGSYSHRPNVDAARWLADAIFPRVRTIFPDAKLYLIGAGIPSDLSGREREGITATGFVDDVDAWLRRCAVFAAPLRYGGGIKNKVLFAMAQAVPVVATRVGVEGIDGLGHDSLFVADGAPDLAERICRLFAEPELADRIGRSGHEVMRKHYSWESVIARLEAIYRSVHPA